MSSPSLLSSLPQSPITLLLTLLPLLTICYIIPLSLYRLYFHPLRHIPGPRLAALTLWYETYHDVFRGGQYTFKIAELHKEYGPLVRISPHEVHCEDPGFIEGVYAIGSGGGSGGGAEQGGKSAGAGEKGGKAGGAGAEKGAHKRDKYVFVADQFQIPYSAFSTVGHDLHRARRGAMARFFSKGAVAGIDALIRAKVGRLCERIEIVAKGKGDDDHEEKGGNKNGAKKGEAKGEKEEVQGAVNMSMAFSCMTADIVTQYAFAYCYDFLESEDFERNFHQGVDAGVRLGPATKHFPGLMKVLYMIPDHLLVKMNPLLGIFMQFQRDCIAQVQQVKAAAAKSEDFDPEKTIFGRLVTAQEIPESEKGVVRLAHEGLNVVSAGTETTAWTLSVALFYILSDRPILDKLYAELEKAIPNPEEMPPTPSLERLPYLIIMTRLQRLAPIPLTYTPSPIYTDSESGKKWSASYTLPPGTPIGMSSYLVHHHEGIFPDPEVFDPERWTGKDGQGLEKYLIPFSKGGRQCLGINLAYAELYAALAAVVRKFGKRMELYDTSFEEDIKCTADFFVPTQKSDRGVRIVLKDE